MNSSTLHNHLSTLKKHGYVSTDADGYRLSSPVADATAADGVLDVVDALKEAGPCEPGALAEALATDASVIRSHLETLEAADYVLEEDGTYRVSLKFLDVGGYRRDQMPLHHVARPKVNKLASDVGELSNLMAEENGLGVYLHQATTDQGQELNTHIGMRIRLHHTALGKAILSELPRERVEAIIDQHGLPRATEKTTTDPDALFSELDEIRDRGYAFDDEERLHGLRCVAAPIVTDEDGVLGSVSVAAPISRMQGERFTESIPERLLKTVNLIELDLNYAN
jgi:DNA-binding IclR family transcriptional regulator